MGTPVKNLVWIVVLGLVGAGFVGCDSSEESTFDSGGSGGGGNAGSGGSSGVGGSGGGPVLDSSGGSGQGDTGVPGNCPEWGDDADCTACLKSNCCSQTQACNSDPGCKAFVECTRACPEPNNGTSTCVQACLVDASATAINGWNAVVVCMGNPCKDACAHL
jgi:hypothetical protein